ncbi:DUF1080 domain-containing protein [bacterium]|nr:DUF1080 domain-containing protein [bacterium]
MWRQLACLLTIYASCFINVHGSETKVEWTSLFNGQDLTHWSVKCKPQDQTATFWNVEDGAITANSLNTPKHDYVWLVSDKEYTNFTFRFKFRAFKDSPGNSGVQIRSRYDEAAGWLDGPQIDIHPPAPWRTGMMWDETRGVQRWIFPDIPKGKWVDESMSKPKRVFYYSDDETPWNLMEITVDGLNIQAKLNGVLITDLMGEGILDDEFHKKHSVGETGFIALQIHTGDKLKIQFKDLEIAETP